MNNVGKRFQMLADRLHSARNDADYSNIKKQIVNEYEHIRNEKAHQRDKMRFDYLHVKLAHIKNLVSEYDKMLTSTATAAAAAAASQINRLQGDPGVAVAGQQQQQQRLTNGVDTNNELSSGYFPRSSSKVYNMTPSPPLQRIDGAGGGGGGGGGGSSGGGGGGRESGGVGSGAGGVMDNGPAIHHQQSHHLIDDDTY